MPAKIKLYKVSDFEYRFDLIADNRAVIGSSDRYSCKSDATDAIDLLKKNAEDGGRHEIVTGSNDKFYFKLKSRDGEEIICSQGFSSLNAAIEGLAVVKKNTVNAEITEVG